MNKNLMEDFDAQLQLQLTDIDNNLDYLVLHDLGHDLQDFPFRPFWNQIDDQIEEDLNE